MPVFFDRSTILDKARVTPEGYFVADAIVARANNIQDYRASELGITDRDPNDVVRVFRPEAEVFAADSLVTATRLPVTLDHPVKDGRSVMVDATNWREFTRGQTDAEVMRDGEFLRVPLRITDADAVNSVLRDRKEFSLGYSANIKFEAGVHDGQAYDATLENIRYNHLAACRNARGGPELRIVDERMPVFDSPEKAKDWLRKAIALHKKHIDGSAPTTGSEGEKSQMLMMEQMENALAELEGDDDVTDGRKKKRKSMSGMKMGDSKVKIVIVDNLPVDVENSAAAEQTISHLVAARDAATQDANAAQRTVAERDVTIAAKDAEITALKDSLEKAKLSPAQLKDAAAAYARTVESAKKLGATVTDAMDENAVKAAAVTAKMGDKASTYTPDQVATAFDTLVSLLGDAAPTAPAADPVRDAIINRPVNVGDANTAFNDARNKRYQRYESAYRSAPAAA